MRPSVFLATAISQMASGASAAPAWTVERSEVAYLFYGEPDKPVLSITCGQEEGETGRDETRIEVEVDAGTKPGAGQVVLVVEEKGGRKEVPLRADICSEADPCTNGVEGEVYRYEASVPGKELALNIGDKGRTLSLDAPGAKVSVAAEAKTFKRFAAMCLNW
jgi:hypothetical protein